MDYVRIGADSASTHTVQTTNGTGGIVWISIPDPDPGRYWEGKPELGGL